MIYFYRYPNYLLQLLLIICLLLSFTFSSAQTITTYAGNGLNNNTGDGGPATEAAISYVSGLSADANGTVYLVSEGNKIRKITASGIITTIACNGSYSDPGDGGPALNAFLNGAVATAVDAIGNVYIVEGAGNRVRKITTSTGIITTFAGTGYGIYGGDGGAATNAGLMTPMGICIDTHNNVYIADMLSHRIRKVDALTGIITTVAGNGRSDASRGDGGPALNAAIPYPMNICMDGNNNLYVLEEFPGITSRVRKIDSRTGIINTVAGNGTDSYSGDGGPAINAGINIPRGLCVDGKNNLYLSEWVQSRIRKVSAATGIITTLAGNGIDGYSGDGGTAISASMYIPISICTFGGNLYVADRNNFRIRKITVIDEACTPTITISASDNNICNNATVTFTATVTGAGLSPAYQWKKNGTNIGTNSASYTTSAINHNDTITCQLTSNASCAIHSEVTSNSIIMKRFDVTPEVTVVASAVAVCSGTPITFTATNTSESPSPFYQWIVDGKEVGTNSTVYTTNTLMDGAIVQCRMTVPQCGGGSTKDYSDPITVTVYPYLQPSVTITASATSICRGNPVTFTATSSQGGDTPVYQWKVNGRNEGTNSTTFTITSLMDRNIISCELTISPTAKCVLTSSAASNTITIKVTEERHPTISITASDTTICSRKPVTFTALVQNADTTPSYQWQLNGNNTGNNSAVYINNMLADGDEVSCILTAHNAGCALVSVNASNSIALSVKSLPVITINPSDTTVMAGNALQLQASVSLNTATYRWAPANGLTNALILSPVTTPLMSTTTYSLHATSFDGCEADGKTVVKVVHPLYMPNSFTPNGDGKNDVFRIPSGISLQLKEFTVFDRWGQKVFTTNDITQGWNGKIKGAAADSGMYAYMINGSDDKETVQIKGTVLLLR